MRPGLKLFLTTLLLVLLALFIGGFIWWQGNRGEIEEVLRKQILETASESLNGELEIQAIQISFPPALQFKGITFKDSKGTPTLTAPSGKVTIKWLRLIQGDLSANLIDEVTIQEPWMLLKENPPGTWNVENILRDDLTSGKPTPEITLTIKNGTVELWRQEQTWKFGLSGSGDLKSDNRILAKGTVTAFGRSIQVSGDWKKEAGKISVSAKEFPIEVLSAAWLEEKDGPSNWQGTVQDLTGTVNRDIEGKWTGIGEGRLKNAGASWREFELSNWNGLVKGSDKALVLHSVAGKINGQPLNLDGQIKLDGELPEFDLAIKTDGFELSALPLAQYGVPDVKGLLKASIQLTGTLGEPTANGEATVQGLGIDQVILGDVSAKLEETKGELVLSQIQAQIFAGQIEGNGRYHWQDAAGNLDLSIGGVDLSLVPARWLPNELALNGRMSGSLNTTIRSGQINSVGNLDFQEGRVEGIPLNQLQFTAGMTTSGGFDRIVGSGRAAGGSIRFEGTQSRLSLSGDGLNLAQVTPVQRFIAASGIFSLQANLQRSGQDWIGPIQTTGQNGEIGYQPFDTLEGSIQLVSGGYAEISEISLLQPGRSHRVKGWLALDGSSSQLQVTSRNIRAENILPWLPSGVFISGNVDNDLMITGSLYNPIAAGQVRLSDGSVGTAQDSTILLDRLNGSYQRNNGVWALSDIQVSNWNMNFSAQGTVEENGHYEIRIFDGQMPLERALWRWPYPATGQTYFSGNLSGQGTDFSFVGEANGPALKMNDQDIQDFRARVEIRDRSILVPEVSFRQGNGAFSFAGVLDGNQRSIKGDLDVKNVQLATALPLADLKIPDLDGILNGTIHIEGKSPHVGIQIEGAVTQGTFRRQKFDNVILDVAMQDRNWTINTLEARIGDEGVFIVRGGLSPEGILDVEVAARDVDASIVPDLAFQDFPLSGPLQLAAQITGPINNPEAAMSIEIQPGSLGGTPFDNFHSLVLLKDHQILIEQMSINKGEYQLSAYGRIPLSAIEKAPDGRSESMDVSIRLDYADLGILPVITPAVTQASGPTAGDLHITGSLAAPEITGKITITDGNIQFLNVRRPLERIELEVLFEGQTFVINKGEAHMGSGNVVLSGKGGLVGTSLSNYEARLVADNLEFDSPMYRGPINMNLALLSGVKQPLLQGDINIERTTIRVPLSMLLESSDGFYLPTLGLDVQVHVGNRVRFYDPVFYDLNPRGEIRIRRTLQNPALDGFLEATSSRIWYLNSQFRIINARADFNIFQGLEPTIRLTAQSRMINTTIDLQAQGLASNMEFKLTSNPPMSQNEIQTLLLFRSGDIDPNSPEFARQFASAGAIALLEMGVQTRGLFGLEAFAQNRLGIDEVRLVPVQFYDQRDESSPSNQFENTYGIRVGKALGEKTYVTYTMALDGDMDGIATLQYDFSRRWNISGEWESFNNNNRYRLYLRGRF